MTYDNTNRGALFINDKKGNEKAPDRKGTLNVNGEEYQVAGWMKKSKNGNPYLSLSVSKKDEQGDHSPAEQDKPQGGGMGGMDEEIPFMPFMGSL